MDNINAYNRHQVSFGCLVDGIESDNPVRVIEALALLEILLLALRKSIEIRF